MSASLVQLVITGHDDRPFPNSFIRQDDATDHLAILIPGYAYGQDLPALYYPARVLSDMGADVLRLERLYSDVPDFKDLPESERARIIVADALSACETGLRQREYRRVTLVGKSIGTLSMARLLKLIPQLETADCIWLTPLLRNERMRQSILDKRPRSLFVIGTADDFYDADLLRELEEGTGGTSVVIEGANHGLEIPDSVIGSIDGMRRIVEAIEAFLRKTPA